MFALVGQLLRLLVSPPNLRDIALENLALRQQLAVFKRKSSAASAGKDVDGAGLIPASLTATADGVRILTMARHTFDRVSG